jgi:NAD(P)-dependent dehydrogenase (short-subunit alcohol dehydrogenase family)
MIDLDGKRIIVTGASSGIGRAAAAQMAASGARVLLVARRDTELKKAVEEIRAAKGEAESCVADVSSQSETRSYVEKAHALWGGVDGVFANAGVGGQFAPVTDYSEQVLDEVIAVNVKSAFFALQAVLPEMIARRAGSIVVTGSLASERGLAGNIGYLISKHAVLGLVRGTAAEVARHNVRVNCIVPGVIRTPMLTGLPGADTAEGLARLGRLAPQGRVGEASEVGAVAAFLMSDAACYVNGQSWGVDGGTLGTLNSGT